jgi:hypothetical protein
MRWSLTLPTTMEAIERTTTDETQAATRKLYADFWTNSQQKTTVPAKVAISASLLHLAETLERNLSKNALVTYLATGPDLQKAPRPTSSHAQITALSRTGIKTISHYPVAFD